MRVSCKVQLGNLPLNSCDFQGLSKQTAVSVCTTEFKLSCSLGKEKATGILSLPVFFLHWNKTFQTLKLKLLHFMYTSRHVKIHRKAKGRDTIAGIWMRFLFWIWQWHRSESNVRCKVPKVYKCEFSSLGHNQCGASCMAPTVWKRWNEIILLFSLLFIVNSGIINTGIAGRSVVCK